MDYRILDLCGGHAGSVADITVFKSSDFFKNLCARLGPDEFLLGDSGYEKRTYLTTPFRQPEINYLLEEDPMCGNSAYYYNHVFSGVRIRVEIAIGILKVLLALCWGVGGGQRLRSPTTHPPPTHDTTRHVSAGCTARRGTAT